jgi:RNase adaptor protein for sRNA GlmZ degradation
MNSTIGLVLTTSSFKKGIPHGARYTFDLSNLRDPIGHKGLRELCDDGRDPLVRDWIDEDPRVGGIIAEICALTSIHILRDKEPSLSIGMIDTHGKWISPAIAEMVAEEMDQIEIPILVSHLCCED